MPLEEGAKEVRYFIEAIDDRGNGRMYPNMETQAPYLMVELDR